MSTEKTKTPNRNQEVKGAGSKFKQSSPAVPPLNEQVVANLACQRWVARGCPMGHPEEDWFEAEHELQSGSRSS